MIPVSVAALADEWAFLGEPDALLFAEQAVAWTPRSETGCGLHQGSRAPGP
jgi:hypothetical protein